MVRIKIFLHYLNVSKGFSLIEIVLVLAIIISISTIGYLSLGKFSKSQNLTYSYTNLLNDLNEAKSNTLSQVKSSKCTAVQTLVGYEIATSTNFYTTKVVCATNPSDSTTYTKTQVKKVTLPNNITINMSPTSSLIFFIPDGTPSVSYSATLKSGTQSVSLGVDEQGVILH
ncbi:MAG: prepilin-type N-terminal cleavage/methylation domain-containing protein [Patescibacteria group bacterium]